MVQDLLLLLVDMSALIAIATATASTDRASVRLAVQGVTTAGARAVCDGAQMCRVGLERAH